MYMYMYMYMYYVYCGIMSGLAAMAKVKLKS